MLHCPALSGRMCTLTSSRGRQIARPTRDEADNLLLLSVFLISEKEDVHTCAEFVELLEEVPGIAL